MLTVSFLFVVHDSDRLISNHVLAQKSARRSNDELHSTDDAAEQNIGNAARCFNVLSETQAIETEVQHHKPRSLTTAVSSSSSRMRASMHT